MLATIPALLLLATPPALSSPEEVSDVRLQQPRRQDTIKLTPVALLNWAAKIEQSSPGLAEQAYRALADDADVRVRSEARYRLAASLARQGKLKDAAILLRHVLDEQPGAQRVRLDLAGLQERLGDEEGARRTLRAASAGPLPKNIARLVDRWSEALRSRRPAGFSIELAMAPDSNINRATSSDTLSTVLGDFAIDPEGKARSGIGIAAAASAYRRFRVSEEVNLIGRINGSGRYYRDEQFRQFDLEASLGAETALGRSRLFVEGAAGQSWFGGELFVRHARATASLRRPLGPRMVGGMKLTGTAIDNRFNALQDGRSLMGELSLERALSSRSGILLTAAGERFHARDPGYRTTRWEAGATGWQELGRVTLFGGMAMGKLGGDEALALFPDARSDRLTRFSFGGSFRDLNFRGLAPFLRVTRERNKSNIAFYDYARTRSEVGFSRAF